jgi:hypothetical protein
MGLTVYYPDPADRYVVCTSTTRPATPFSGLLIYETDTGLFNTWTGAVWMEVARTSAWTSWSLARTNWNLGNGSETKGWCRVGKAVTVEISFVFGSTSTISGVPSFSLPFVPLTNGLLPIAMFDASAFASRTGYASYNAGSAVTSLLSDTGFLGAAAPIPWAVDDFIRIAGTFQAT